MYNVLIHFIVRPQFSYILKVSHATFFLKGDETGTRSKNHVKNLHSILIGTKVHLGFTEIKQAIKQSLIASKFSRGSMGINAWNTFVLKIEHPYMVRKFKKFLDMGELTTHGKNQSASFSFGVVNYSQKLHKKHSIRAAAYGIRQFFLG